MAIAQQTQCGSSLEDVAIAGSPWSLMAIALRFPPFFFILFFLSALLRLVAT